MVFFRCLLSALCLASAQVYALEIKGIAVSEKADCERIRSMDLRPGLFAKSCENREPMWVLEVEFLSGRATLGVKQSKDGIVSTVLVSRFNFEEALEALTLKYGSPKMVVSTIQNRLGAKFEQQTATWDDEKSILSLERHGSKIGEPVLMLMSRQSIEDGAKNRAKSAGNI